MANTTVKSAPRDAQVMAAILKDSGVVEYEPRLIHQMLEFTYQYVTDVLEDAKVYSQHANKKNIDVDDVKLAVQCRTDHSFTNPPPKELLQEIARQKNGQPLPPIKPYGGPRSLPDRYCLTNPNFRLRSSKKPQSRIQFGLPSQQRISLPTQAKGLSVKGLGSSTGQSVTVLPKASPSGTGATNQVTIISKPAVATAKPTIRINTGPAAAGIGASGLAQIVTQTTPISTSGTSLLPTSITASSATIVPSTSAFGSSSSTLSFNPLKRKAEEDDYDG
ncbi:transcription initiation factor TFIID subunit 9-like isoform X3 [Babylonia areolata]|uniref:transcription initiation factor TFIID subunit 9-like isoform X3 n=1 Tax=Babylonia areolata TaxID=304850 RepID=UPI003FD4D225